MSTYTAENVKDLDITTPTESSTPPSEVNNSDREIKDVIKNQWATIVKSAAYTLTPQDSLILVSGTTTITIPASTDVSSSAFFKEYTIIKTDAAGTNVTIARTGSDTFNGATSITLTKQYEGAKIFGSGVADWKFLRIKELVAGTDYLAPTGDGSGLTGISTSDTITNMPAGAYTVTAAQCTGRTTLTNAGAGASSVTPALPAGAANYVIHFNHVDSGDLVIDPNGTQHLYIDGVSLGAGVALTSKKKGAKYTLVWNSSANWWEVNYYNTDVEVQTVLSGDISTTAVYNAFENATGLSVTIVAGASGVVRIDYSLIPRNSAADFVYFRLDRSGTYTSMGAMKGGVGDEENIVGFRIITGLTPGTSYTWQVQWCVASGTASIINGSNPEISQAILIATTR